jgi:hypothetical protein
MQENNHSKVKFEHERSRLVHNIHICRRTNESLVSIIFELNSGVGTVLSVYRRGMSQQGQGFLFYVVVQTGSGAHPAS